MFFINKEYGEFRKTSYSTNCLYTLYKESAKD